MDGHLLCLLLTRQQPEVMYLSECLSVGKSFVLIKEKCPVAQGRIAFVLLYPALLVLSHVDVCEMSLFFFGLVKNVKEMSCIHCKYRRSSCQDLDTDMHSWKNRMLLD